MFKKISISHNEKRLKTGHKDAQLKAVQNLVRLGASETTSLLLSAIKESQDPEVARACIGALGKLNAPEAVEPLIRLLQEEQDVDTVRTALTALGRLADIRALEPVCSHLDNEHTQDVAAKTLDALPGELSLQIRVRQLLVLDRLDNLAALGEPALDCLFNFLEEPDTVANIRIKTLTVLGKLGNLAAGPHLLTALNDADWRIRRNAAFALGALKYGPAVDALIDRLQDEDEDVRRAASLALGDLEDLRAFEILRQIADDDISGWVRQAARHALRILRRPVKAVS
ncbi:MAG: HEAT repeat domain-containing protein [bacterium]|nr:HEAT repeat domain-containing protein [bacterium]